MICTHLHRETNPTSCRWLRTEPIQYILQDPRWLQSITTRTAEQDVSERVQASQSHNMHRVVGFEPLAPAAFFVRIILTFMGAQQGTKAQAEGPSAAAKVLAPSLLLCCGLWAALFLAKVCSSSCRCLTQCACCSTPLPRQNWVAWGCLGWLALKGCGRSSWCPLPSEARSLDFILGKRSDVNGKTCSAVLCAGLAGILAEEPGVRVLASLPKATWQGATYKGGVIEDSGVWPV